ncbi:DUF4956 domain-containing protein [Roseinatronobacter monicus]|uniref:DUF4956 domain-containing protein n=1 Tax=Roseinatronobacter monicus TaxID=393481 RepID=UPI003F3101CC
MPVDLLILARDLALNLFAVSILALGLYFARHHRRDYAVGFIAINISLFVVASVLTVSAEFTIGIGFALFAILSIVRLRSDEATWIEIGYTMVALVLGLVNGLPGPPFEIKLLLSAVLVLAMFVADHFVLLSPARHQRCRVILETIVIDRKELFYLVGRRLGGTVRHLLIIEVDHVAEKMRLDVRYTADTQPPRAPETIEPTLHDPDGQIQARSDGP